MGTWGPGIFEDDDARDIRNQFDRLVPEHGVVQALPIVLAKWGQLLVDFGREDVLWLSVAGSCLRHDELPAHVRDQAMLAIERQLGLMAGSTTQFDVRRSQRLREFKDMLAQRSNGDRPQLD